MNVSQWLYISILNTFFIAYLGFKNNLEIKKVLKNKSFLFFSLFFLFSIISVIKSINYAESISRLNEFFAIFCSLFLLLNFYLQKALNSKFILILFSFALGLEVLGSLNQYRLINSYTDFNFSMSNEIRGFTGNKNVAAASVAFKIPFLIILFDMVKSYKLIKKIFLFIILTASFYVIMLYSARAVFLSISLTIVSLIFLISFKRFLFGQKITFSLDLKQIFLYISPLILAFIIFSSKYNGSERIAVDNRIQSIVSNAGDQSIGQRLRFYGHSLESIKSNPIFGVGVGQWKIYSIKYDANNMYSYVVPFFAHNDFLEIFAEIGVFGFLFYLLFFFLIFRLNWQIIKDWILNNHKFSSGIICLSPLLIYFIDANLNFPLSRPIMQVQLLLYIVLIYYFNSSKEHENR